MRIQTAARALVILVVIAAGLALCVPLVAARLRSPDVSTDTTYAYNSGRDVTTFTTEHRFGLEKSFVGPTRVFIGLEQRANGREPLPLPDRPLALRVIVAEDDAESPPLILVIDGRPQTVPCTGDRRYVISPELREQLLAAQKLECAAGLVRFDGVHLLDSLRRFLKVEPER